MIQPRQQITAETPDMQNTIGCLSVYQSNPLKPVITSSQLGIIIFFNTLLAEFWVQQTNITGQNQAQLRIRCLLKSQINKR